MDISEWLVLVVEDEHDSAQVVSEILTHYGVRQIHTVHNGHECLEMLNEMEPTLIIMDLAMPEMDGWDTLAEIRANPTTAPIPVVAITAYHSAKVAQDASQAGFDAYFAKPVNPVSFMETLGNIVG